MSQSDPPRPKKSVALSGVIAGTTAVCIVGQGGDAGRARSTSARSLVSLSR